MTPWAYAENIVIYFCIALMLSVCVYFGAYWLALSPFVLIAWLNSPKPSDE